MQKPKHILIKFLSLSFKAYKPYYFVLVFKTLMTTATTLVSAYTISLIIGFLERGLYDQAVIASLILVGVEVILALLMNFSTRLFEIHKSRMEEKINQVLAKKIMSLPFSYLENPEYLELKKNAQMGINNMGAIYSLLGLFSVLISSSLSLIGLASIIISFDPILISILGAGIIINIVMVLFFMRVQMKFYNELLPINYKFGYYLDTMLNANCSKDFRLYSVFSLIEKKFQTYNKEVDSYFSKIFIKIGVYNSLVSTVRYIQMAGIYILVGLRTIAKKSSISSFSLTISSAISFSDCISKMIEASGEFFRAMEYIRPMIVLMEIEEEKRDSPHVLTEVNSIRFEHVSFSYPNTTVTVLDDISFTINKNEKISIVGLNGAGKTTIVKLICRLYEPVSGTIYINDIPIDAYEKNSYLSLISAVFQDFKLFSCSIKENISPFLDLEEVKRLSYEVGIGEKIESLPKQWESILSKSYDEDGVEMSGGQTQKVAIARALAKKSDLLILDEPTSALDPLAEAEIYENFNSLAKGKTSIYISHRMSSSIFCDKILVIDGGKISDFDSHQNLMKNTESLYYKLFMTQAKNYAIEK